ncbi:hypothetical protein ABPG74_017964 [Tetrahymena malaccensis]
MEFINIRKINQNKSFNNEHQKLSKSFDFSFDVIHSQNVSESKTFSTNHTVYSNCFPNQTKKNFRKFSQKMLHLEKQISLPKKQMISSQAKIDEYQTLNKRLLEGFLKLRKQILQSENYVNDEKDLRNSNSKQSVNLDETNISTLNQYEPLANIKLKLFKRNLKKNQIQNQQKNENLLCTDQKSKYSLFDNFVSKCSFKTVDLSSQLNSNINKEEHSKLSSQISQNCDQKCSNQFLIKSQQQDQKKNNLITKKQSLQINNISKAKIDKNKKENTFYNFQSNDQSTRMSFYNLNKSNSKADKMRYSQDSFFNDSFLNQEETQNLNSSRCLSPQSESSLIFNQPKEVHSEQTQIKSELNSKIQKIKLNLCRPKSQDPVTKPTKTLFLNKNQKDQTGFAEKYQINEKSINYSVDNIKSQIQDIFSIKIENQTEEINQEHDDRVIINQNKKTNTERKSSLQIIRNNCKEQVSEWNKEIFHKQSKGQTKKSELKELIQKQDSKESIQDFKLFQIEIDQQIDQTQFDIFNKYLSQNTYFMGKKLKNQKPSNSNDSSQKMFCRKSMSSSKFRNQLNVPLNKLFNEQIVDQVKPSKKPTELNAQDAYARQEQKNRSQHQYQQKPLNIPGRKYSHDNYQSNKNQKFFEIQMLSYKPVSLLTRNNSIDMQTQNYFNKQLITNCLDKSQIINYGVLQ